MVAKLHHLIILSREVERNILLSLGHNTFSYRFLELYGAFSWWLPLGHSLYLFHDWPHPKTLYRVAVQYWSSSVLCECLNCILNLSEEIYGQDRATLTQFPEIRLFLLHHLGYNWCSALWILREVRTKAHTWSSMVEYRAWRSDTAISFRSPLRFSPPFDTARIQCLRFISSSSSLFHPETSTLTSFSTTSKGYTAETDCTLQVLGRQKMDLWPQKGQAFWVLWLELRVELVQAVRPHPLFPSNLLYKAAELAFGVSSLLIFDILCFGRLHVLLLIHENKVSPSAVEWNEKDPQEEESSEVLGFWATVSPLALWLVESYRR